MQSRFSRVSRGLATSKIQAKNDRHSEEASSVFVVACVCSGDKPNALRRPRDEAACGALFRNIVHDLAVATTSRTDRSALPRPLQECGEETCRPIGTCPAPITSSGTRRLPNPHWRRIGHGGEFASPDGGRWWQMLGHSAKLRHKEAAGNCRAAHSQNRGGGGPRGGP